MTVATEKSNEYARHGEWANNETQVERFVASAFGVGTRKARAYGNTCDSER